MSTLSPSFAFRSNRLLVLNEIVSTERTYCKNISIFYTLFIKNIELNNFKILKNISTIILFSNVEQIINLNLKLLNDLENRLIIEQEYYKLQNINFDDYNITTRIAAESIITNNSNKSNEESSHSSASNSNTCKKGLLIVTATLDSFANIFLNYAPLFKLYCQYAQNYAATMLKVDECLEEDPEFAKFIEKCEADIRCQNQKFSSFFIQPIQRIPRYILLLNELGKHCVYNPDTKVDEPALIKEAVHAMDNAAFVVNEAIRDRENCETILAIQRKFVENTEHFYAPKRVFIKEGYLIKFDRRNGRFKYIEEITMGLKLHRMIQLDETFAVSDKLDKVYEELAGDQISSAFCILSAQKSFIVLAEDVSSKNSWIAALQKCLTDLKHDATGDGAAPVWTSDANSNKCSLCSVLFTLLNRKHHCRRCGKIVCDECSRNRQVLPNIGTDPVRVCYVCMNDLITKRIETNSEPERRDTKKLSMTVESNSETSLNKNLFIPIPKPITDDSKLLIMFDLFVTEQCYCSALDILISCYIKPLLAANKVARSSIFSVFSGTPKDAIPSVENLPQFQIFCNSLEQILTVNLQVLKSLHFLVTNWSPESTSIGGIFLRFAPLFKTYSVYAKQYDEACIVFMKPEFLVYSENCMQSTHCQEFTKIYRKSADIQALLTMPMERIQNYAKVVRNLLKNTCSDDEDEYALLTEAIASLNESAGHIAECMVSHGNRLRLIEIEKTFTGTPKLLKADRILISSGTLYKIDRTGAPTSYIFHLFNDAYCYSEETALGYKLHRLTEFDSNCIISENPNPSPNYPHSFVIISAQKSFVVAASSKDIRDVWFRDFTIALENWRKKNVVQTNFNKNLGVKTNEEELVIAPVWAPDIHGTNCTICHAEFTLWKRKHHCRNCGILCCHDCSSSTRILPHIDPNNAVRVCATCMKRFNRVSVAVK